jgi:hypothetical protein
MLPAHSFDQFATYSDWFKNTVLLSSSDLRLCVGFVANGFGENDRNLVTGVFEKIELKW